MTVDAEESRVATIVEDSPRNPYSASRPVGGRVGFYGRQDELRRVERTLNDPNQNCLVIYGQRRIGRTSILLQLERRLDRKRFHPVYYSLADQASRPLG